jgi:T5SS/PEP-CTERM-associated repeat protein
VGNDPFSPSGLGDLHIGAPFEDTLRSSSGRIEVSDGGLLSVKRNTYMSSIASTAVVTVDGAGSRWENLGGAIFVGYSGNFDHGHGDASLVITNGGSVTSQNAAVGHLAGVCSFGDCLAEVTVDGPGSTWSTGDLLVLSGVVTVSNGGKIVAGMASLDIGAELRGNGIMQSTTVSSNGLVSPGLSTGVLTIDGNYEQGAFGELLVELASASQYDQLIVDNDIFVMGGTLSVELIDGFVPGNGDSFNILDFDDLSGMFSLDLPALPVFLVWDTTQLHTAGILAVINALVGDYNADGTVNAADYTVWRNALESGNLAADGNDDGMITRLDYDVWKLHFGESLDSGAASTSAQNVPEPSSGLLRILVLFLVIFDPRGNILLRSHQSAR